MEGHNDVGKADKSTVLKPDHVINYADITDSLLKPPPTDDAVTVRPSRPKTDDGEITFTNPFKDEPNCGDVRFRPNKNELPGDENFERMRQSFQRLVGRPISSFDRSVPDDLGCARAVSYALEDTFKVPIREVNCAGLEEAIRENGWRKITLDEIQPGDVIIGKRAPGRHGHAAIYTGDGMVFNNNSDDRQMQFDNFNKFLAIEETGTPEYKEIRVFTRRAKN